MNKYLKLIALLMVFSLLMTLFIACNNDSGNESGDENNNESSFNNDESNDESDPDETLSGEDDIKPSDTPILADLDNDGTDDEILITYADEQKTSATIKVTSGKDGTEYMNEVFSLNASKKGGYYLKLGKNGSYDELVRWSYWDQGNEEVIFQYDVFTFLADGTEKPLDGQSYKFKIGANDNIGAGNAVLERMLNMLNEHIFPSFSYSTFLLADNRGNEILISTADNMLESERLTYRLEDFISGDPEDSDNETTDQTENTAPPVVDGSMPEMQIADGFTVLTTENLSILVTEDHSKKMHVARVAALKNENGEHALYFDVLTNDNKILSSVTWKGYYQLFVNNDGLLILLRISVSPITQRGTALYQLYEVSDSKISGYDVVELETPQINAVAGEGKTINFTVGSPAATAMYEGLFLDFTYTFRDELKKEADKGHEVYLIADNYLNPAEPKVYSDKQKMPVPNFEDKSIVEKYEWEYAIGLFE